MGAPGQNTVNGADVLLAGACLKPSGTLKMTVDVANFWIAENFNNILSAVDTSSQALQSRTTRCGRSGWREWLRATGHLAWPCGATADVRYTPSSVKREVGKQDTQAIYELWRKAYRALKRKHPDKSDVWYSKQVAKDKKLNPLGRDSSTIKKHMKP